MAPASFLHVVRKFALFGIFVLIAFSLLAGCSRKDTKRESSSGPSNGSSDSAGGIPPGATELTLPKDAQRSPIVRKHDKFTEIASQTLKPSPADQTASVKGKVTITVPGGLLKDSKLLTISVPQEPQKPGRRHELVGDFDISLGGIKRFDKPLIIAMPFDASRLDPALSAKYQFTAACWDEGREMWQTVPCQVDEKTKSVSIRARHLSRWAIWYRSVRGFKCIEQYWVDKQGGYWVADTDGKDWDGDTVWFRVFYDPKQDGPMASHKGAKLLTGSSCVMGTLARAYTRCREAGFKPPTGVFDVFVDPSLTGAAAWDSTWFGIDHIMYVPGISTWESEAEPRQNVSHEFFHAVQNQYFNAPISMHLRSWWMEATADYFAGKVAYDDDAAVWQYGIRFVKPYYPEAPLRYFKDVTVGEADTAQAYDEAATKVDMFQKHQYHTSVFVDYLVGDDKDHKKFNKLWSEVAKAWVTEAYSTAVEDAISAYLVADRKRSLAKEYEQFALTWYFEGKCASPAAAKGKIPDVRKKNSYTISPQGALAVPVAVDGGYASQFCKVSTDSNEPVKCYFIAHDIPEGVTAVVVANLSNSRWPGLGVLDGRAGSRRLVNGQPIFLGVSQTISQHILVVNPTKQAADFTVDVKDMAASLTPKQVRIREGESVTFTLNFANQPPGVTFLWNFDDGNSKGESAETSTPSVTHVYNKAIEGVFMKKVKVRMKNPVTGDFGLEAQADVDVRHK